MTARLDHTDSFMRDLGVEAYRVGGSVRDEVLGRKPKDADYVVRGVTMRELEGLLRHNTRGVTALVLRNRQQVGWIATVGKEQIEVVLPRTERSTGPGRHDFEMTLDPDLPLVKDAERRDFTFNALYKDVNDPSRQAYDPTGRGYDDLIHRRINVTHADSFRDDPLRTLRALRFISTLDYELGPETRALMALHAESVTGLTQAGVSGTVLEELTKLLMGQCPDKALRAARDTGVLAVVFPELAPMVGFEQGSRYHDMTTDEHTFKALETAAHVDAPLRVRMALLFHDSGKPEVAWVGKDGRKHYYAQDGSKRHPLDGQHATEDHEVAGERIWRAAANRLNAPNDLKSDVATLIRNHMVACQKVNPVKVRRERVRLGDELLRDLYLMRMCDLSGKGKANQKHLEIMRDMEVARIDAMIDNIPTSLRDLKINGRDVLRFTDDSQKIGRVLRTLLDEVVVGADEQKLSREWQLTAIERLV